jgi:hypothetical protein
MQTAVVVSGTLRQLVNASSSWQFPHGCDYFLVVDQNIYATANLTAIGNSFDQLSANLAQCHVNFNSVTVVVDSGMSEQFKHHSSINMINKWKIAYYNLLPYSVFRRYERVIVLRPDLYLYKKKPIKDLFDIMPGDNQIYSTQLIIPDPTPSRNFNIMNDVLFMVNTATLARLGNEFGAYYLANYADTTDHGYDIHAMMARYCTENNIQVLDTLNDYFEFAIVRDTAEDLFTNGTLRPEHSFIDIRQREQAWWQKTYAHTQQ